MNSLECFDINEKPILHVKLSDLKKENSAEVDVLVDTGFSGWLLLNYEIYLNKGFKGTKDPVRVGMDSTLL